jgi:aminoglycoside phosphotransferase (APT) family kinase protein
MTDLDMAVRDYVSQTMPDCSRERIDSVEALVPGENHAIYRVSFRGPGDEVTQVVVRVGSPDDAGRGRAEREARVLDRVGGTAGPKLYSFSADAPGFAGPVMCLEFIAGRHQDLAEAEPERLTRLGQLIRWLHGQPVSDIEDFEDMRLSAYVEQRWQQHLVSRVGAIRDPLPDELQERLQGAVAGASAAVQELKGLAEAAFEERLVLLHADISGANVLWRPEPVLIDWEYARLGDPADEVAYLFTQNALSGAQEDAFWAGYSDGLGPAQVSQVAGRVRWWRPITLLGSVLWWLDAWSRTEAARSVGRTDPSLPQEPGYYLDRAVRRLDWFEPE